MFAVIQASGKQYIVEPGKKITFDSRLGEEGKSISFDQVLLVHSKTTSVGTPLVEGALVEGKVLEHSRSDKKIVFKYKPKKRYRVKKGHRQDQTVVEITKIGK